MNNAERVQLKLDLLHALGHHLPGDAEILDFGCGDGAKVAEFLSRGFDCYGCDIRLRNSELTERLRSEERLRAIEKPYRLPFRDHQFDFVYSDQVMEHVRNHQLAFGEIRRVLKPGGVCLHVFPSRYTPIEPHVGVPLASWYRPYWWLKFWANLGVRSKYQKGCPAQEVALRNYRYLRSKTNYLHRSELIAMSRMFFASHQFCMKQALAYHPKIKGSLRILKDLPTVPRLLDALGSRVLLQVK